MCASTMIFSSTLPLLCEAEVVVVGAGPAGCAAAITASRMGRRTLLIERKGFAGGAAVSQLVPVVLSQNGRDFQGVWHEFMLEMKERGLVNEMVRGEQCDYWLSATYSPESAKQAWDRLLAEAGVRVLYHAVAYDAALSKNRITALAVNTRGGNGYVAGKVVIDCTGDGHVCFLAGAEFELGNGEGPVSQGATKMFRLAGAAKPERVLTAENGEKLRADYMAAMKRGEFGARAITSGFIMDYIFNRAGKQLPDGTLLLNTARMLNVNSLDPWELTKAEIEGRAVAKECAEFFLKYVPGSENASFLETSMELGIRASRRIAGLARITVDDVLALRKFPDGIARGSWEVDVHSPKSYTYKVLETFPAYADYHKKVAKGDYYEIPLGCLIPKKSENLLVAGRCISSDSDAQGSLRIQQTCMATGEAAGCAASLAISAGCLVPELDHGRVVARLEETRAAQRVAFDILAPGGDR